mmetsp:Transcript_7575/g.22121  ORF Transcript_7575/g.22121 Transcript_7575/m.22121 type:complete len:219 (+) Transcript_7575:95-751(+)
MLFSSHSTCLQSTRGRLLGRGSRDRRVPIHRPGGVAQRARHRRSCHILYRHRRHARRPRRPHLARRPARDDARLEHEGGWVVFADRRLGLGLALDVVAKDKLDGRAGELRREAEVDELWHRGQLGSRSDLDVDQAVAVPHVGAARRDADARDHGRGAAKHAAQVAGAGVELHVLDASEGSAEDRLDLVRLLGWRLARHGHDLSTLAEEQPRGVCADVT